MTQTLDEKQLYDFITRDNLKRAIEKNEIKLYYHPKVKINSMNKSYEIQGVEALIRWFNERNNFIRPTKIISIAESKGFIGELDKWILEKAFTDMKKIRDRVNKHINLSLNISLEQLKRKEFIHNIVEIARENEFQLSNLELDIVDSIDSKVAEYLRPVFIKLKCLGISIILDDYGSYHECLEFVTSSDVDGIK
ncbi:MAG: EAL domain-containing protein, partial [Sarcina sp.]